MFVLEGGFLGFEPKFPLFSLALNPFMEVSMLKLWESFSALVDRKVDGLSSNAKVLLALLIVLVCFIVMIRTSYVLGAENTCVNSGLVLGVGDDGFVCVERVVVNERAVSNSPLPVNFTYRGDL